MSGRETGIERGGLALFRRYDAPTDFTGWHATALASIVPPAEEYVTGIDCADRWGLRRRGTRLVLTDERVVAFSPNPTAPVKRSHWLEDMVNVGYDAGVITAELRFSGVGFYESYRVPKRLGREFAEAAREGMRAAQS
jgi:hypothetical protein